MEETSFIRHPRKYQLAILEKAKKENVIAVGPTGSGKTHIAAMLIEHLVKVSTKAYSEINMVFVVNRVLLVHQQHTYLVKYFEEITYDDTFKSLSIGKYWGEKKGIDYWRKRNWGKEIQSRQVFVLTAQILVNLLTHGFLTMENLDLIIFDECHHCHKNSPYNKTMKEFYFCWKDMKRKVPKIFGMSASPFTFPTHKVTEFQENQFNSKLDNIEKNLDSRVCVLGTSPEGHIELRTYVPEPKILQQDYNTEFDYNSQKYFLIIEEVRKIYYEKKKEYIQKFLSHCLHVLCETGSWGIYRFLVDVKESLKDKNSSIYRSFTRTYRFSKEEELGMIIDELLSRLGKHDEIPQEHQLSNKVNVLIEILDLYQKRKKDFCGLIFVERRNVAYILNQIIKAFKVLNISCENLVGHGREESNPKLFSMKSEQQQRLMKAFGKTVNVLVTTAVAEEGIDIQACHLVIRFDIFHDLKAFIQSKGRARKKNSDFIIMYNRSSFEHNEQMKMIRMCEKKLIRTCIKGVRKEAIKREWVDKDAITIDETGAKVGLTNSLMKLAHYCSLLPSDMYTGVLKPKFRITGVKPRLVATVTLPNNSTVNVPISGREQRNVKLAQQSAALEAIKMLFEKGLLDNNLVPIHEENIKLIHRDIYRDLNSIKTKRDNLLTYEVSSSSSHFSNNWVESEEEATDLHVYSWKVDERKLCFPFGLVTLEEFPKDVPPVDVSFTEYNEDRYTRLSLLHLGTVTLSSKQIKLLKRFHMFVFSIVLKLRFRGFRNKIYLIVPVTKDGKINMDMIKGCLNIGSIPTTPSVGFKMGDVVKTRYNHRVYIVNEESEFTPESQFKTGNFTTFEEYFVSEHPKYFEKHTIDKTKRLIEVVSLPLSENILIPHTIHKVKRYRPLWLLSDHVDILPFNEEMINIMKKMGGIFWFLENYLITDDLNKLLKIPLNLSYLKEAMTATSTQEKFNYERLEFFGDSILKWICAQDLFFRNPDYHEGILSKKQYYLTSNRFLFNKNLEKNLYKFVFTEMFTPRMWKPPGYNHLVKKLVLSNKLLSDLIESILAAVYLSGGLVYAKYFLIDLGFPIKLSFYSKYVIPKFKSTKSVWERYRLSEVEDIIKYKFKHRSLLVQALTHQSYKNYEIRCYQRLEFLGDAALDIVVTEYFYKKYSLTSPGNLSDLKSLAVSNEFFAYVVLKCNIYKYIIHNSKYFTTAIDKYVKCLNEHPDFIHPDSPKFLGDIFESLAAAIFIDNNYDLNKMKEVLWPIYEPFLEKFARLDRIRINPVRKLCELLQGYGHTQFKFVMNSACQKNNFKANCVCIFYDINLGYSEGENKKSARKKCATKVLDILGKNQHFLKYSSDVKKEEKYIDNDEYEMELKKEVIRKVKTKERKERMEKQEMIKKREIQIETEKQKNYIKEKLELHRRKVEKQRQEVLKVEKSGKENVVILKRKKEEVVKIVDVEDDDCETDDEMDIDGEVPKGTELKGRNEMEEKKMKQFLEDIDNSGKVKMKRRKEFDDSSVNLYPDVLQETVKVGESVKERMEEERRKMEEEKRREKEEEKKKKEEEKVAEDLKRGEDERGKREEGEKEKEEERKLLEEKEKFEKRLKEINMKLSNIKK